MIKIILVSAVSLVASSSVMAGGYSWYHPSNVANANGSASAGSESKTLGRVKNNGSDGFQSARSGAYNNSSASTGVNYSATKGKASQYSKDYAKYVGGSLIKGVNVVDNEASQYGSNPDASYTNSTTNDSTEKFANLTVNYGHSGAQNSSNTFYTSANLGNTSSTSTNGGAFGDTIGWGATTDATYSGKTNAKSGSNFKFHKHF